MMLADELRQAPEAWRGRPARWPRRWPSWPRRLRRRPPRVVVTCARGSSAHAATFAKHLIELYLGMPVAAAAPNIASVYRRPLDLKGQLFLAVSQSGPQRRPAGERRDGAARPGALTVGARQRYRTSPLAEACDIVLPICAGPERSVAATKTFVASLAALLRLVAAGPRTAACTPRSIGCRSGWQRPADSIGARRSIRWPRRRA